MAFAERYGARLRFDHDVGKWFVWSGQHWQGETTDLAFSYARELARELAKGQAHKVRLASSKTGFAGGVERFARSDRTFAVTAQYGTTTSICSGPPAGPWTCEPATSCRRRPGLHHQTRRRGASRDGALPAMAAVPA